MTVAAIAAGAYQRAAGMVDSPFAKAKEPTAASATGGFGDILQDIAGKFAEGMHAADRQTTQAVQGNGSLVDVVTAVAESEVALETVVGVRDRVIAAYEEIMRMPI